METYRRFQEAREEIVGLYDAHEDRWPAAVLPSGSVYGEYDWLYPSWGATDGELRLTFAGGGARSGASFLLLPPRIELPPFSDGFAFRVTRTGRCPDLREEPSDEGAVLDCLPDGTRVVLNHPPDQAEEDWLRQLAVAPWSGDDDCCNYGVFVRTEDGLEGWVAHDHLEHD